MAPVPLTSDRRNNEERSPQPIVMTTGKSLECAFDWGRKRASDRTALRQVYVGGKMSCVMKVQLASEYEAKTAVLSKAAADPWRNIGTSSKEKQEKLGRTATDAPLKSACSPYLVDRFRSARRES